MAVFSTPFTVPANYTYDSNKILISGGKASLREDLTDVYARYHLNEISGVVAFDDSGNMRNGTLLNMEDGDWVSAKLGNGLAFDGANESVNLGGIAGFEYNQPFSLECWFLTSGAGTYTFLSKMQTVGPSRGWLFYIQTGLMKFTLRNSTPSKEAWVQTINTFNDGLFHHAILTYNGSGLASGITLYVDNVSETLTIIQDSLAANTILNTGNCSIGSRNNANLYFLGTIDEAVIYNRLLSTAEASYRYNSNSGREDFIKYSDKPTIYKTVGDSGTIFAYNNFAVTDGITEGSKGYQLSEDGITWKYWDGGAWSVAGASDYNTDTVVNTNINSFSAVSNNIYVKTFFISDGFQREEIDEIQITYTEKANPTIDAGTNKEVFDNLFLSPFSDSSFSDPDGTVDHAYYKIGGEVDIWTEILQGGYATLLEAVHAFSYQFTNTGIITVHLQAEDNLGGTNEDFLIVTVKKYIKTVNVKDVVTGDHIINFDFNPGDSSGTAQKDSPFIYSWDYGNFDVTIEKIFFYVKQETIFVENEDELTIFIQASAFLNENKASVGLMTEDDRLSVMTWLQQGGQLITNPTSCTIELYDQDEVLRYIDTTSVHDGGHFSFSKTPSELPNEGVYHLEVTVVAGGLPFTNVIPVGLMERKLISFEGAIHINVDNGSSGTVFPHGTPQHPVNNWLDAKAIADANDFRRIKVVGDLVIGVGESIAGYTFSGESTHIASIMLNGGSTLQTSFEDIEVNGVLNGASHIHHCHINNVSGLESHVHLATLFGPISLSGVSIISGSGSGNTQSVPVEVSINGAILELHEFSGDIKIKDKTSDKIAQLDVAAGKVIIDSSCVAGTIVIHGICDIEDNSGPNCTVIRPLIVDLHDEALGELGLDPENNTLILYRVDGTILKEFNLPFTLDTLPAYIGRIPK